MATAPTWDLTALLNAADPRAGRAERHLWLVRLFEWLRHSGGVVAARKAAGDREPATTAAAGEGATPAPVLRLRQLCQVLERNAEHRDKVRALLTAFAREADAVSLFADFGFAPRASFGSELMQRLRSRLLPATPDTRSLAELFPLLFDGADVAWIERIDSSTLQRLAALWPAEGWRDAMLDGIAFLCSAIRAAGFGSGLRLRMSDEALRSDPFMPLSDAAEAFCHAVRAGDEPALRREALSLRALLDACRRAADSMAPHFEEYGISLHLVFEADQLRSRAQRVEQLLDALLGEHPAAEGQRLLSHLVQVQAQRLSVRSLFAQHGTQLSRQVAERNASTGEHYIARSGDEYRDMLRRAAGGGAVIALTVFAKFALGSLGLAAFWNGVWSGVNYAASFVAIMLLHWTVATKQPAMTAPAMAAKLAEVRPDAPDGDAAVEAFVDEIGHLIRSQVAGIAGNLAMCFPLVLAVQWFCVALFGAPAVGAKDALYVLDSISLLGPTALYAAFTGVLLFASSIIAGWVENWFVFHRLDSAIAWNPRFVSRLGAARAQRWARWWRLNISGLAGNAALGLMLGIVPVLLSFVGPNIEVRHVTLATGQLAAALGAFGWPLLQAPEFWWCVAGIFSIGVLNLTVSFWLAFKVALRARQVPLRARATIRRAIRRRLRHAPLSFLRPPAAAA